jgi:hypothetical protein
MGKTPGHDRQFTHIGGLNFWPFSYWPIIVPVVPAIFAIALIQFLGMPVEVPKLASIDVGTDALGSRRHAANLINYGLAVAVHTGICASAVLYFTLEMRRIGIVHRTALFAMMALMLVIVASLMIGLAQLDQIPALY